MAKKEIMKRKSTEDAAGKSGERYQTLFELSLDGIYQTDAGGIFRMMNQAGAEIFGHGSPEEMIGLPALKYWRDPKAREAFVDELPCSVSQDLIFMNYESQPVPVVVLS